VFNGIDLTELGGNTIAGNFFGLAPNGTNVSPRVTGQAIQINSESGTNMIGGPTPGARNLIAGNQFGISVTSFGAGLGVCYIEGNFIGTDRHGTNALPNANAITISSKRNRIGGPTVGQRNVISGNNVGVQITGPYNLVQGNFIGTDVTGRFALGNNAVLSINGGTNQVGGASVTPGAPPGNLISGNTLSTPFSVSGTGNIIQGNLVGLDVTGTNRLGNGGSSGLAVNGPFTLVGGTNAGEGNVFSGNAGAGIITSTVGTPRQVQMGLRLSF